MISASAIGKPMNFRITGAHRETGEDLKIVIDSPDKRSAEKWACENEIVWSDISPTEVGGASVQPSSQPWAAATPVDYRSNESHKPNLILLVTVSIFVVLSFFVFQWYSRVTAKEKSEKEATERIEAEAARRSQEESDKLKRSLAEYGSPEAQARRNALDSQINFGMMRLARDDKEHKETNARWAKIRELAGSITPDLPKEKANAILAQIDALKREGERVNEEHSKRDALEEEQLKNWQRISGSQ